MSVSIGRGFGCSVTLNQRLCLLECAPKLFNLRKQKRSCPASSADADHGTVTSSLSQTFEFLRSWKHAWPAQRRNFSLPFHIHGRPVPIPANIWGVVNLEIVLHPTIDPPAELTSDLVVVPPSVITGDPRWVGDNAAIPELVHALIWSWQPVIADILPSELQGNGILFWHALTACEILGCIAIRQRTLHWMFLLLGTINSIVLWCTKAETVETYLSICRARALFRWTEGARY